MQTFPTIYKRDTNGKIRVWFMELDESRFRTTAGLKDGQLVTSEWTLCESKNIGRANQTSPAEQALSEVESHYKKKLEGEYHESESDTDTAKWFKPMLAKKWEDRKDKITYPCIFQPTLDGIRCIANRDGLWSRTGKPITACPHVFNELKSLFDENPDLVLDGELYNHYLKDDFNEIVSMVRKTKFSEDDLEKSVSMVQYHVYDMPSADGRPFMERYNALYGLMRSLQINMPQSIIHVVYSYPCEDIEAVDSNYGAALLEGYEGGIIRVDAPYEQKRSNNLLKRKDFDDDEFLIIDVQEGKGNWSGCAKKIVIRTAAGHECEATVQGSMDYCRHVLATADNYIGKQATVRFFGYTPDGALRFPVAKVLHEDKRW
jgi:DNA ligase-1